MDMSLEYLKREWEQVKLEIKCAISEDERYRLLRYGRSISETAFTLYGCDLYKELGGID